MDYLRRKRLARSKTKELDGIETTNPKPQQQQKQKQPSIVPPPPPSILTDKPQTSSPTRTSTSSSSRDIPPPAASSSSRDISLSSSSRDNAPGKNAKLTRATTAPAANSTSSSSSRNRKPSHPKLKPPRRVSEPLEQVPINDFLDNAVRDAYVDLESPRQSTLVPPSSSASLAKSIEEAMKNVTIPDTAAVPPVEEPRRAPEPADHRNNAKSSPTSTKSTLDDYVTLYKCSICRFKDTPATVVLKHMRESHPHPTEGLVWQITDVRVHESSREFSPPLRSQTARTASPARSRTASPARMGGPRKANTFPAQKAPPPPPAKPPPSAPLPPLPGAAGGNVETEPQGSPVMKYETQDLYAKTETQVINDSSTTRHETEPYYGYKENQTPVNGSDGNLGRYAMQEHVDPADLKKHENIRLQQLRKEGSSRPQTPQPTKTETERAITDSRPSTAHESPVAERKGSGTVNIEQSRKDSGANAAVPPAVEQPRKDSGANAVPPPPVEQPRKDSEANILLQDDSTASDSEDEEEEEDFEPMDESLAKFYRERAAESLLAGRYEEADQAILRLERHAATKPGVDGWGANLYRKTINECIESHKLDVAERLIDRFMDRYSANRDDITGFHTRMAFKNEEAKKYTQASRSLDKAADLGGAWATSAAYVKQYKRVSRLNLLNALLSRPRDLELAEKHVNKLLSFLEKVNEGRSEWKSKDLTERANLIAIRGCIRYLQKLPQTAIDELADSAADNKNLLVANLKFKATEYLARAHFELKQIDVAAKYCRRALTGYRAVDKYSKSSTSAVNFMIKIQEARGDSLEADGYRSMLRPDEAEDGPGFSPLNPAGMTSPGGSGRSSSVLQKLVLGPEWSKAKSVMERYHFPQDILQHYANSADASDWTKGSTNPTFRWSQFLDAAQGVVADSVRLGLNDLLRAMLELQNIPYILSRLSKTYPGSTTLPHSEFLLSNFDFMDTWRPPKAKKSFVGRFRPKTMKVIPLSLATDKDNLAAVKILINGKANVNLASGGGNTALHIAVKNGRLDMIKVLLEAGADVSVANERGKTALDMARHADVVKLLRPRMYLLGKENLGTQSVFDFAAECL